MYNKPQKLVAEFVGTFALVFFGVGAIISDQFLRTNANGPSAYGWLGIALAQGLAIGILVTSLGHISGGHFNPAVTIGFWVTRKFSTFDTLAYWVAQTCGGHCRRVSAAANCPFDAWSSVQLGTPDLASGVTRTTGMIFEAVMTFFLVFVVFATAVDERGAFNKIAGFAIGLTVTMGVCSEDRLRAGRSIRRAHLVRRSPPIIGPTTACIGLALWREAWRRAGSTTCYFFPCQDINSILSRSD